MTRHDDRESSERISVTTGPELPGPVLIDGHVHFYDCFDLPGFLEAARHNLGAVVPRGPWTGCLFLTERAQDAWFRRWRDDSAGRPHSAGAWTLRALEDGVTLLAEHQAGPRILVLAGRQIVARDGLEVLAVGSDRSHRAGLDFPDAVHSARETGGLTIVPWGFGKWWGDRGKLVKALITRSEPSSIFLGDNGGRPRIGGYPRLLSLGRSRGFKVLGGSDPLPFPAQMRRVGSFGFVLPGPANLSRPGGGILEAVRGLGEQPASFGKALSLRSFLSVQARVHWRKRVGERNPR